MKTYQCIVCGFEYSEADGHPEDGIAPGTTWANVPAKWACPECGVAKSRFERVEMCWSTLRLLLLPSRQRWQLARCAEQGGALQNT
jgi:rubredoxin